MKPSTLTQSRLYSTWFCKEIKWRRQTIKSGSAFKGQLYFQVGQMEGPTVPSDSREAQSTEGEGKGRHSPSPLGVCGICPRKIVKKL